MTDAPSPRDSISIRDTTRRHRLRQSDIAAEVGLSQSTVSLVLSGRASHMNISAATQHRVLETAKRLGYVADPVGQRLAGGRNRLLSVFTFEPVFSKESENYYHPFLVGVEQEAEALGYDLLLCTSATGRNGRRSIYRDGVNRLRVADGAILLGLTTDRSELAHLIEERFPFIHIGRRMLDDVDVPFVATDYSQATSDAVAHLTELGHKSIGYLVPDMDDEPTIDREQGFQAAAARLGLSNRLARYHRPDALSAADVDWLIESGATAIITHRASDASAVYEMLALRGLEVPKDYSLVALDEPWKDLIEGVILAGISIPRHEMGAAAVRLLVTNLAAVPEHSPQLCLPCRFVPGDTCAPPSTTTTRDA